MTKNIANRRPTFEEIELDKRMGTVDEARRRIINAGGFPLFQKIIDDPLFLGDLLRFYREYVPSALMYVTFFKWLRDNKLERHLTGGSLEKQIRWQENFYRKFYGKDFQINLKKIFITAERLPVIKAGLEAGCANYALIKAMPKILSNVDTLMNGAEFMFERLVKPLKKDGFKIWEETGAGRWTTLTLRELLKRGIAVEPEEFEAEMFKKDWVAEEVRVISRKISAPLIQRGSLEMIFTSDMADIPADQVIINKDGEIVNPDDRSYVSAIAKKVRMISREEENILASQMYVRNKTYLAPSTWEFRRDVVDHQDKNIMPPVSVAFSHSVSHGFHLHSDIADYSGSGGRWRLAL